MESMFWICFGWFVIGLCVGMSIVLIIHP